MSSPEFYDNYIKTQIDSGINDRIYSLYRRLCRVGLNTNSTVLEIGCGIGTLTYLLARKIKKGSIEATDLSPQSIEYVKKHIAAPNLFLYSGDILHLTPQQRKFDFVLLFDVIEHIPTEKHAALFAKIQDWMHDKSYLLINIPNPGYILYDQKNNPNVLQEVDQAIFTDHLATVLGKAQLDILQFETYSVWVQNDYQFIVVRKRIDFEEKVLSNDRNFLQKAIVWCGRKWRKIIYPYPPEL